MFAPLSRFFRRPDTEAANHAFVEGLRVEHPREPRSRRSERVLAICWVLIVAKSVAIHWACARYSVPISPWWIILPTLAFGAVCTLVYWRRD